MVNQGMVCKMFQLQQYAMWFSILIGTLCTNSLCFVKSKTVFSNSIFTSRFTYGQAVGFYRFFTVHIHCISGTILNLSHQPINNYFQKPIFLNGRVFYFSI